MENSGQDNKQVDTQNSDLFDVAPLNVDPENKHLIKTTTVGINTTRTSWGTNYDIRGDLPNPKNFVIYPWISSTIEPDTNIKSLDPSAEHE